MPAQSDAENALIALAAEALFPNGAGGPSTVRLYRGWPNATALSADLAAGIVNVSVFPVPGATTNTTRYAPDWTVTPVAPSLVASVNGTSVTFSGSAGLGQLAGILVDGVPYVHRTSAGDTPALVAATLAVGIAANRIALASGSGVSIPGAAKLTARTAADVTYVQELRRQQQQFRITAWCPTPDLRDATCEGIDVAFAATPFLSLAGGTAARLRFISTTTFDTRQDAALYRRDLLYSVEFPTTQTVTEPSMLFGVLELGTTTITA